MVDISDAIKLFNEVHSRFDYGPDKFSERTSIHVHVNCLPLTSQEVRNIVLVYAIFEEVFFKLVHPKRRHNIHCVPLTETFLPNNYKHSLLSLVARWHKYTALNLLPLKRYGTIEFRHMHGHDDPELLSEWLSAIRGLFDVGLKIQVTPANLSDNTVLDMYYGIFGTGYRMDKKELFSLIENSLLDVKQSV
jgi:hypothetical protein